MKKQQSKAKQHRTQHFINTLIDNNINDVAALIKRSLDKEPPGTIQEKLREVDRLKGWLDSFRPLSSPVVEEMKKLYDVKFTYNSNAIEGNTLTQNETAMVLEKGITIGGKTLKEHLEVIGHKEAIDYIEELAQGSSGIDERSIKDIHSIIMHKIDRKEAGSYRNLDVRSAGTDHVYPPHYRIHELMEDFINWLESDEFRGLHTIEKATTAHYKLSCIHPFRDGNGRTSRLLMNLILMQNGYTVAVISNEIRTEYIDALIHAQNNNDDTSCFLELVINAVKESLIDYLAVASTGPNTDDKGILFYEAIKEVLLPDGD